MLEIYALVTSTIEEMQFGYGARNGHQLRKAIFANSLIDAE